MELTKQQREQLLRYRDGILQWNDKVNLTAITELEEFEIKHFVDSLAIVGQAELQGAERIIDVGTGAGFPGIPLCEKTFYTHGFSGKADKNYQRFS